MTRHFFSIALLTLLTLLPSFAQSETPGGSLPNHLISTEPIFIVLGAPNISYEKRVFDLPIYVGGGITTGKVLFVKINHSYGIYAKLLLNDPQPDDLAIPFLFGSIGTMSVSGPTENGDRKISGGALMGGGGLRLSLLNLVIDGRVAFSIPSYSKTEFIRNDTKLTFGQPSIAVGVQIGIGF